MGQGFYRQPNISYSQASKVVSDHIQSRQEIKTYSGSNSTSEDNILELITCKAQVYITEVDHSDSDDDDIIT